MNSTYNLVSNHNAILEQMLTKRSHLVHFSNHVWLARKPVAFSLPTLSRKRFIIRFIDDADRSQFEKLIEERETLRARLPWLRADRRVEAKVFSVPRTQCLGLTLSRWKAEIKVILEFIVRVSDCRSGPVIMGLRPGH